MPSNIWTTSLLPWVQIEPIANYCLTSWVWICFIDFLEMIDDEDEVLLELAKALGDFLPYIGSKSNIGNLLKLLEALSTVEEGAVRDRASESINSLIAKIKIPDFEDELIALFIRLVKGDWYTSKVSSTKVMMTIYPHVSSSGQKQLFKLFAPLCEDSIPQVRKASAIALNNLILQIPKAPEADLIKLFQALQTDNQDMVKMQGIDSCINFAKKLSSSKYETHIIPYLKKYAEEKSWRLRYLFANQILDLAAALGEDLAQSKLLVYYCDFLTDPESEVRTAAVSKLNIFVKNLDKDHTLNKIIPAFKTLVDDSFTYVRVALAENLLSVCPVIGKAQTNEHIIPIFLQLLRDNESEVRIAVFKKIMNLNEVIGIESLSQSILPAITELSNEKNWRTRVSVIEMFPLLAEQLVGSNS